MRARLRYWSRITGAYVTGRGDSNLSFWHTPLAVNRLEAADIEGVRRYPMDFTAKTGFKNHRDEHGVIMLNYRGHLGLQYNPNAVAQQALGWFDRYLDTGSPEHRSAFLTQADHFLRSGRTVRGGVHCGAAPSPGSSGRASAQGGGVLLWEYDFPFEMRDHLIAPWRSALAQGQAVSVLIRAHQLTGDRAYADAAHQGYRAFRHLAREHEGGVLDDEDGFTWLEEYVVDPPNHVLNGFIWALWGVRDYAAYFGSPHARHLWKRCLRTLEANVERYDLGFWTSYDRPRGCGRSLPVMPASAYYQDLHAVQMRAMHNLTGNGLYLDLHERWRAYLRSHWRRAISQSWKAYFKLRHF